jgi:hypothetical protein
MMDRLELQDKVEAVVDVWYNATSKATHIEDDDYENLINRIVDLIEGGVGQRSPHLADADERKLLTQWITNSTRFYAAAPVE